MEKNVDKDLVKAAVGYWSGFLKDPLSFELDNGEPSQHAMLNMLRMAAVKPFDSERIKIFEEQLTKDITQKLENSDSCNLSVDYHPDSVLGSCLDLAFGEKGYISMQVFPCKTTMWITKDNIQYSQGYRKPVEILYPVAAKDSNESDRSNK